MAEQGIQGSFIWHEIYSGDPAASKGFYTDLLGWGTKEMQMGPDQTYTMFTQGGSDLGGFMPVQDGQPPHWLVYMGVDDVDGTAAKAESLGGKVLAPPMDIPPGRMAVLQDPAGAVFAVFKPSG